MDDDDGDDDDDGFFPGKSLKFERSSYVHGPSDMSKHINNTPFHIWLSTNHYTTSPNLKIQKGDRKSFGAQICEAKADGQPGVDLQK